MLYGSDLVVSTVGANSRGRVGFQILQIDPLLPGAKLKIAEKTVKIHRSRVMEKLCIDSVAELVRLAEKAGVKPSD